MHLILVRHGDVHNPQNIIYGRLPRFGLSELGVRQIGETAAWLGSHYRVDRIFSSPLRRATETARIIARTVDAPLSVARQLAEPRSAIQGLPMAELPRLIPHAYESTGDENETLDAIVARLRDFLDRIPTIRTAAEETLVAVSHGDPVMILRGVALGVPITPALLRSGQDYPSRGTAIVLESESARVGEWRYREVFVPSQLAPADQLQTHAYRHPEATPPK